MVQGHLHLFGRPQDAGRVRLAIGAVHREAWVISRGDADPDAVPLVEDNAGAPQVHRGQHQLTRFERGQLGGAPPGGQAYGPVGHQHGLSVGIDIGQPHHQVSVHLVNLHPESHQNPARDLHRLAQLGRGEDSHIFASLHLGALVARPGGEGEVAAANRGRGGGGIEGVSAAPPGTGRAGLGQRAARLQVIAHRGSLGRPVSGRTPNIARRLGVRHIPHDVVADCRDVRRLLGDQRVVQLEVVVEQNPEVVGAGRRDAVAGEGQLSLLDLGGAAMGPGPDEQLLLALGPHAALVLIATPGIDGALDEDVVPATPVEPSRLDRLVLILGLDRGPKGVFEGVLGHLQQEVRATLVLEPAGDHAMAKHPPIEYAVLVQVGRGHPGVEQLEPGGRGRGPHVLHNAQCRVAHGGDQAIVKGLVLHDVGHGVVAVFQRAVSVGGKDHVLSLGGVFSAHILGHHHDSVAGIQRPRGLLVLLVIRGADQQSGPRRLGLFGQVDVGGQLDPVAHLDHHLEVLGLGEPGEGEDGHNNSDHDKASAMGHGGHVTGSLLPCASWTTATPSVPSPRLPGRARWACFA